VVHYYPGVPQVSSSISVFNHQGGSEFVERQETAESKSAKI
jgi:hypothetical protein